MEELGLGGEWVDKISQEFSSLVKITDINRHNTLRQKCVDDDISPKYAWDE
jgi:hypothetical protein